MDIATGVVGCFGVAVQLIETVDKIQKFLRSLDEVPEDLATINSALTVIRIVLIKIKAVGNICNNDQALLTALPECERAVNFLDSVVKDLERGVDDMHWVQRIRARIKAARREGKLEKLESKLEQAKSTLLLAVNLQEVEMMQTIVQQLAAMHVRDLTNAISVCSYPTYEAEPLNCSKDAINHLLPCPSDLLKRAPDIDRGKCCGQKISSSLSTSSGAPSFEQNTGGSVSNNNNSTMMENALSVNYGRSSVARMRARETLSRADFWNMRTILGFMHFSSKKYKQAKSHFANKDGRLYEGEEFVLETSFQLMPSSWLTWLGITSALTASITKSSYTGWKAALRVYNVVPDNSPVFALCATGNISGVMGLFAQGLASPFDVSSDGYTLLHIAAGNLHPELIRLLLQHGADGTARTGEHALMPWEMTAIFPCVTLGIRYKRSYPYMFCRFNKLQVQNDYETYNMQRRVLLALTELERNQILIDCPTTSKFSTFQTMLVLEETLTANEFCASTHNEAGSSRPCSWLLRNLQHSDEGPSWMDLIVQVLLLGFVDLPDLVREIRQYYNDESLKADMYQVARGGLDRTEYDDGTKTFVSEVRKYGFSNFKVFLEEIKDIHFIITKPFYNFELERWTTQPGTLARAALAEQLSFWWFRFLLEYLNVNLEEFAIQECAVLDDGWTPKTFIALFEDQTPLYEDQFVFLDFDRSCRLCGSFPYTQYWSRNPWNELWREHVKKIKAGFSPDDPESEKERALQRDCERWTHGFACEDICIQCQLSMEEKLDMEREDCQENSPFLLDIDI